MDFIFDPSLVLYLPLYKLGGASFMSKDAYGHLCTVTGASWRPNGRWFDGIDDKIDLGNNIVLYPAQFTWEFWAQIDATAENEVLLGTPTDIRKPWEILPQGANHIDCAIRQSDLTQVNTSFTDLIVKGVGFVHFVFTGDGSTLKGYLNSIMSTITGSYDGTLDTANRNNNILGVARSNTWWLNATIGEVRLYNRALTPQEIQRNYLATKWRYR